ncbi:MAG: glucose-6-phosphate isomerase, partial [Halobacteria archaeon]|nr:glucose-6-phosphate isomerase [Halobacteria archaeon]
MTVMNETKSWQALAKHYKKVSTLQMRDLFLDDPQRFEKFSLRFNDVLLDYSKNRITEETLQILHGLVEEVELPSWIEKMFAGEAINNTEHRAVLHVALRNMSGQPMYVDGEDVMPLVKAELDKMEALSEAIRSRKWRGVSGQPITDIVNIGIGGSDLGPVMITEALRPYGVHDLRVHFVSNVDENHILDTLEKVRPETTLFIVASKTFTTQETMLNANTARSWCLRTIGDEAALKKHFVAVSANIAAAEQFGIAKENVFAMWDWVGGRYSLWSAIGLPIAIYIGMENYRSLLLGAYEMDVHFRTAPAAENLPITLALLGVWYNN